MFTRGIGSALILGIVALILVVIGVGYFVMQGNPSADGDSMMEEEDVMKEEGEEDTMMEKEEVMKEDDSMMMEKSGTYEPYSAQKLSLAAKEDVILFFHADWCPICRSIESEILQNPEAIPTGVHILKVDYDSETVLRQKYGVTVQYTFVQVDAEGNLISKWNSTTLSSALAKIQ